MFKIGDWIQILYMEGEPHYTNKIGKITSTGKDPYGEDYLRGTWGGLNVYPSKDTINKIKFPEDK